MVYSNRDDFHKTAAPAYPFHIAAGNAVNEQGLPDTSSHRTGTRYRSGTIYAGYVQAGKVEDGSEASWMTRSISEALAIAKEVDDRTIAEGEMD
jgi:hypothetical protein